MRGIERALGVSRQTFSRWLMAHITCLPPFRQSIAMAQGHEILELDELWSFVRHKGQKRWLWVALNRRTRQIVAFVIGDRSAQTCRKLWQRIPYEYRQGHSYSDFWQAYEQLLTTGKHQLVGKETGKLPMSNVGTAPCVNDWLVMFVRPCHFLNWISFTTL